MSGFGEMGNLLKQAQEMQRQIDRVRTDLRARVVEGIAGGGVVRVRMSADRQEVSRVEIAPDVLRSGDMRLIEDLVQGAIQDALRRARAAEEEAIGKVTGGMHLPGLF
ncbi:MAG: YbaB/EbfC family nucleoid-associated protein [Planctomycetota bacterium]